MSLMRKESREQPSTTKGGELGSRRKRRQAPEPNGCFLLALADALRDILADERRRAA